MGAPTYDSWNSAKEDDILRNLNLGRFSQIPRTVCSVSPFLESYCRSNLFKCEIIPLLYIYLIASV